MAILRRLRPDPTPGARGSAGCASRVGAGCRPRRAPLRSLGLPLDALLLRGAEARIRPGDPATRGHRVPHRRRCHAGTHRRCRSWRRCSTWRRGSCPSCTPGRAAVATGPPVARRRPASREPGPGRITGDGGRGRRASWTWTGTGSRSCHSPRTMRSGPGHPTPRCSGGSGTRIASRSGSWSWVADTTPAPTCRRCSPRCAPCATGGPATADLPCLVLVGAAGDDPEAAIAGDPARRTPRRPGPGPADTAAPRGRASGAGGGGGRACPAGAVGCHRHVRARGARRRASRSSPRAPVRCRRSSGAAGIIVEPREPGRLAAALVTLWSGGPVAAQVTRAAQARAAGPRRRWSDVALDTRTAYVAAVATHGAVAPETR